MPRISLNKLRGCLDEHIKKVTDDDERIVISGHRKSIAVLVPIGDLWALHEFETLEDKALLAISRERLAKFEAGEEKVISMEEVLKTFGFVIDGDTIEFKEDRDEKTAY